MTLTRACANRKEFVFVETSTIFGVLFSESICVNTEKPFIEALNLSLAMLFVNIFSPVDCCGGKNECRSIALIENSFFSTRSRDFADSSEGSTDSKHRAVGNHWSPGFK